MNDASPLRYPGGKWRLCHFFQQLIELNFETPPKYVEPYTGGGSLALSLLFSGDVQAVALNDLDPAIYALWWSILNRTEDFCRLTRTVPITPDEWARQRNIYKNPTRYGRLTLGFATFFLNRTNHSGILNAGMIGGKSQNGLWKLDARFNRLELVRRVQRIANHGSRIELTNLDAISLIKKKSRSRNTLVYLDPPYFHAGQRLYLNAYKPGDHLAVRDKVVKLHCPWVVSYDTNAEIRKLYSAYRVRKVSLTHTARVAVKGNELIFFSSELKIPRIGRQPAIVSTK